MFSDTYPMKLVQDCLYEVTGKVSHSHNITDVKARNMIILIPIDKSTPYIFAYSHIAH